MTERSQGRHKYMDVRNQLASGIESGAFVQEGGNMLVPSSQLASMLGVSRVTFNRATGMLRDEGILMPKQGVGIFVVKRHLSEAEEDSVVDPERAKERGLQLVGELVRRGVTEHLSSYLGAVSGLTAKEGSIALENAHRNAANNSAAIAGILAELRQIAENEALKTVLATDEQGYRNMAESDLERAQELHGFTYPKE